MNVLGLDTSTAALFLLGVGAAVAVLVGIRLVLAGAKMGWRRRQEQKHLSELSEKLERVEAERRGEEEAEDDGR